MTNQKKTYVCKTCKKSFEQWESQVKGKDAYCSRKCYWATMRGKPPHNKGRHDVYSKPCNVCGNIIKGEKSHIARRVYCSKKCSHEGQRVYYVSENGKYTKLYLVWRGMKNRCYNNKVKDYSRYGGRGVAVAEEWVDNYPAFRDWAFSNGYEEGLQIDRIDNDGNYTPSNCRWATRIEQCSNRRDTVYLTISGKTKTINEWAEISGLSREAIRQRHYSGKTGIDLITKGE